MRPLPYFEEQRRQMADLCAAVGVDPDRALYVEWRADRPQMACFTVLDGPEPDARHVEEHPLPEGWSARFA